ncbi:MULTISPECIES: hypothetical protein [Bradyrhizobium]|uniref:hypothetical protein n=1 Tax=Bradyrhizobium TaxID=374 RepID=UPI001EDACD4A|nr:hypothetical protein [Bradyrhizobium zhengyangense]MCG2645428.1 hypothetical protein [Bradyrhizobium zhengyangense]
MSQDWERVERELAEAMPGIVPSIDQLDFLPDNDSIRGLRGRSLQTTETLLEHIARALEDGRIEAQAD